MNLFRNSFVRLLLIIAICFCFVLMIEQAWAVCTAFDTAHCG